METHLLLIFSGPKISILLMPPGAHLDCLEKFVNYDQHRTT